MKLLKLIVLAIAAMLVMGVTGNAFAFHDGGVARCEGCHTMHNSLKSKVMRTDKNGTTEGSGVVLTGNSYLLQGSDPSSTCLGCHGSGSTLSGYHVATGTGSGGTATANGYTGTTLPAQRGPGGDFSWLKVAFATVSTTAGKNMGASFGATADETKNRHGHHIVAVDYGYLASTDYASNMGPGGTYPVSSLGCNSCHDPHNNTTREAADAGKAISISGSYGGVPVAGTAAGVYRFLGGVGYAIPTAVAGVLTPAFANVPPSAVAPSTYNVSEAAAQNRVAYGSNMSEWCANCHGNLQNTQVDATSTHRHVASNSALLSTAAPDLSVPATMYNAYVNSGNTTGGVNASSYLSLVPYEMGASKAVADLLAATTSTAGPTGGENVMCLSCHRAHASGFDSMARFDIGNSFITDTAGNYAFSNGAHEMSADTTGYYSAAYYDRPSSQFGASQRSLCNKCHAKD